MTQVQINMKFIKNIKDSQNLAYDGFIYRKNKPNDKSYCKCSLSSCLALSTLNDMPVGFGQQHLDMSKKSGLKGSTTWTTHQSTQLLINPPLIMCLHSRLRLIELYGSTSTLMGQGWWTAWKPGIGNLREKACTFTQTSSQSSRHWKTSLIRIT